MKRAPFYLPPQQQGMVTLLASVVLVLLATLTVFAVSRNLLLENRMSGNEIRHRQAHEAAAAGLDFAISYVGTTGGADKVAPLDVADTLNVETLGNNSKYAVAFCDPDQNLAAISCPVAPGAVVCTATPVARLSVPRIVACGWSDDNLSRVRMVQDMGVVADLPGDRGLPNPLTAKGAVNVQGSATVTNYFTNLTVWSGGALQSIGNAGKTFVRNPNVPPPAPGTAPPGPPNSCSTSADYVCLTDKNTTGPDVISGDPTLAPGVNLFENLFGYTNIQAFVDAKKITPLNGANSADVAKLENLRGETAVIRGPLSQNMNFTIGSRDRPVILVVDGDWTGGGNTTIYARAVYVSGNIDLQGNKTVYGSTVVNGNVQGTGSLDLIYDPHVTNTDGTGGPIGRRGAIAGSWRDW